MFGHVLKITVRSANPQTEKKKINKKLSDTVPFLRRYLHEFKKKKKK